MVRVASFFRRWASSQISRSRLPSLWNFLVCFLKVSYDTMRTSYGLLGERNWSICMMTSSALDSARAHTLTFPLSHLSHSESQLPTSDVGHTMTALFTMGFPPSS